MLTDACLGSLDASRLARLDAQLSQVGGDRASKTMALHAQIYAAATRYDPQTCCVIHTHSTHCVALTLRSHGEELLAPVTAYFVMKVGHVPVIPYDRPGAPDVAIQVAAAIRRYGDAGIPICAVMLSALLGPNRVARFTGVRDGGAGGARGDCPPGVRRRFGGGASLRIADRGAAERLRRPMVTRSYGLTNPERQARLRSLSARRIAPNRLRYWAGVRFTCRRNSLEKNPASS